MGSRFTDSEIAAVALGSLAAAFATYLAAAALVRDGMGWLVLPLIAAVLWREYVFGRMRDELERLRGG